MTTKWDVVAALKKSGLLSSDRIIMMMLVDVADAETAYVAEQWSPSLTELARWTGLGRSTVAARLDELERLGWVKRERPPTAEAIARGARTCYHLTIGETVEKAKPSRPANPTRTSPAAGPVQASDQVTAGSPDAGLVQPLDEGSPAAGLPLVQPLDLPSPAAGHKNHPPTEGGSPTSSHQEPTTPPSTAAAAEETPAKPKRTKRPEPHRADVERLCAALADHRARLGCKRPEVTDAWRKDARLLIDADEIDLNTALAVLDWSQADDFWKANIRGIPKFRKQFDTLRLRMESDRGRRRTAYQDPPNRDTAAYRKDF
jgi:DNA-binding MarR family transcriptional regulator